VALVPRRAEDEGEVIFLRKGDPKMKRISLCAALLAFVPGITEAYYGCGYGVHYSPYALSYHNSGLIPCDVEYTPYALSYHNSGLVYGYGICDYGYGFAIGVPRHAAIRGTTVRTASHSRSFAQAAPRAAQPCARATTCRSDPVATIRQHLQTKGFAAARIDRVLCVNNALVSVDVMVKERNLLIKYWNPEEVQRLTAQETVNQKVYARYKQNWERFAQQYQQAGGAIYTVNASEPQTIVAALESCSRLAPPAPGNNAPGPTVLYAKN
jgi:hypothetical protein